MKESGAESPEWDIIIVGAGPAGTAAALETLNKNYRVALMDKAVFPRDKICGDALSPDVIRQLDIILPSLAERFSQLEYRQRIEGLRLIAPDERRFELNLNRNAKKEGYVVSRMDLDALMMDEVKSHPEISVFEDTEILGIDREDGFLTVKTGRGSFTTRLLIGADGNHSIVAKLLAGRNSLDRRHHCAALRQYYENVSWPLGRNHIELHYVEGALPGYIWVFPMSGNRANVGIGMLSEDVSRRKVNLKKVLEHHLQTNPQMIERFKDARALESAKGFGIPLGSRKYSLSGDRYMLAGDAACLVDPLSGEGIANAIRSGRFVAKYALMALEANRCDAAFLKAYDRKIYAMMGDEFRISRFIQRSFRHKRVVNSTLWLCSRSQSFRKLLHYLFIDTHFFTEWARLSYYTRRFRRKPRVKPESIGQAEEMPGHPVQDSGQAGLFK